MLLPVTHQYSHGVMHIVHFAIRLRISKMGGASVMRDSDNGGVIYHPLFFLTGFVLTVRNHPLFDCNRGWVKETVDPSAKEFEQTSSLVSAICLSGMLSEFISQSTAMLVGSHGGQLAMLCKKLC
jgi:hypothetical protein